LARANHKCETCGIKNRVYYTYLGKLKYVFESITEANAYKAIGFKIRRVVLTIAHIIPDLANNEDINLIAECQACHLRRDKELHRVNRLLNKKG
jgi:hypothetical protein